MQTVVHLEKKKERGGGAKCEVQGRGMLLALAVGYWQASVVGGDEAECFCRVAGVSIVLLLLRAALCSCLAECSCKKNPPTVITPQVERKRNNNE